MKFSIGRIKLSIISSMLLLFLTELSPGARAQTIIVDERAFGQYLAACSRSGLASDSLASMMNEADRINTNLATNCAFYARLMVHANNNYVAIPSTTDAIAIRDSVSQLQSDFAVKFDKLSKDFNDNFIKAITCANSTNADIRKASNCP